MNSERQEALSTQIVIAGGGPAGLAAAQAASRSGIPCLVIERAPELGGQYKAVSQSSTSHGMARHELQTIEQLIGSLDGQAIQVLANARLWRADPGVIYVHAGETSYRVEYQALILATGAREWVAPFPGWTLPGVMTVGAAQRMLVGSGVGPGKRVLVAGTGPFLIRGAAMLVRAGVQVLGVLEATPIGRYLRLGLAALMKDRHLIADTLRDIYTLRAAKVTMLTGRALVEVQGEGEVEIAHSAKLRDGAEIDPATKDTWDVDAVCVTHGLVANTRLAQALGCDLAYDTVTGSFYVAHDENLHSSQAGIYVCGEAAGIGGVRKALLEGELAGLAAARELEPDLKGTLAPRMDKLRQARKLALKAARYLNALYDRTQSLSALATLETVVCRCEDVTLSKLQAAFVEGDGTLRDLKIRTRLGMGLCQGRTCEHYASHALAQHTRVSPDQVESLKIRPPLEPVPLQIMADLSEDD